MSTSFSTPKKQKPNPHPYAIKTSTTGLLSNSSSFSTTSGTHHYIPPSPSPSPTQTGFEGEGRYTTTTTRHRYSSSESPRPLPLPPSAAGLLGSDDDDDTPRRGITTRAQRAYSLPQLPKDPKRWTPAEVSIYLASSLNAAAVGGGGGGHDLPTRVARDIATFVKDKKITGRRFLSLNEVDLEEYGINQLWRTTLVDASRALRRNVIRGRVWDNPTEHDTTNRDNDDDYDDDNDNTLSSNSNHVITNRKRSLSTTSQSRGRVRDMVDTLERSSSSSSASSSEQDEEGSSTRRNKDTTTSKRDNHHRHRSLEQQQQQQQQPMQQQQGRLPQRGSVSTLFGTSRSRPEREIEDEESTITAHTRRNVNNAPRLLPLPPTGPRTSNHHYAHIVSPSHTGTSHSLPPPSPLDHHQQQTAPAPYHALNTQPPLSQHHQPFIFPSHSHSQQHNPTPPITLDYYELGFKNSSSFPLSPPIRSPNPQRYVVQHNNVQPPPSSSSSTPGVGHSTGGSSKGSRLLPYPPIVGEAAELFHPRPRMGVGVGGLAGELENGLEDSDVFVEDGEVEGGDEGDETTYHSALEIQTGIDDDSENGGSGEGSPPPPTAAAAAAFAVTSGDNTPGSGNDIETRVGGSDATDDGVEHLPEKGKEEGELIIRDAPQCETRPRVISGELEAAWEMELGETVKRIGSNGISAAAAGGGGSISSIGGTKTRTRPRKREPISEIGRKNGSGRMSEVDGLSKKKKMMTGTGVLDSPELFEAPDSVQVASCAAEGDHTIEDENASVPSLSGSAALDSTSSSSSARQSALDERESEIAILESSLNVRESSIAERDSLITKRESSIADRESSITGRESSITDRESSIADRESSIADRESSLDIRESSITSRESIISKLEFDIAARESVLTSSESEIQRRVGDVEQREVEVEKRESEVGNREREVSECERRVEKREGEVGKREQEVSECETRVEKRESEVEKREQGVSECETRAEKRESEVENREQGVSECETRVEKRESEVENREREVSECETGVEKRVSEVGNREQEVSDRETRVERREVEVKEWYQRKLSEIDERVLVLDVPPTTTTTITASEAASSSTPEASSCVCTAKSKWPPSPMEFARRLCATFLLPVLGEDTPEILLPGNGAAADSSTSELSSTTSSTLTTSTSTTTISSSSPTLPGVSIWSLKRDFFLNRLLGATVGGGSFLVLVGIGICVIFLRGVVRRVLKVGSGGFAR